MRYTHCVMSYVPSFNSFDRNWMQTSLEYILKSKMYTGQHDDGKLCECNLIGDALKQNHVYLINCRSIYA